MEKISRRSFLKLSLLSAGALAFRPWETSGFSLEDWPEGQLLGRNCMGGMINMRQKPSVNSAVVQTLYEDAVFEWGREVIGEAPSGVFSKRWVETPNGYVYAPTVQPVKYIPNIPIETLPVHGEEAGFWAEVTVPYVDLVMDNPPARSPWFKEIQFPRLYFSQVMWVDQIQKSESGQVLYRINEKAGSYGDIFWADASAFRVITEDEIAPLSPEVENKKIVVNLSHQTLSCYEDNREVYFCRISSGAKFNASGEAVDEWSTPPGEHPIWRKLVSIHMSGGGTGAGWDTPGVAWTSLFVGDGVAIHSTFWHNDFGTQRSHGCVNTKPEDAKWVFRWTSPVVGYLPGDITVEWPGGTIVDVVEV